MDWEKIKNAYFVGLKGIGMTALACMLDDNGVKISGSDLAETYVTDPIIARRGWQCWPGFSKDHITNPDLVIFSAGHGGEGNVEVQAAYEKKIPVLTLTQLLALLAKNKKNILVVGVGGKSSTTAMLATVLSKSGLDVSYFTGVAQLDPLGDPGRFTASGQWLVIEGDEYFDPKLKQPKFLSLNPSVVIIPNLAYDHPDVYLSAKDTLFYFQKLLHKLPSDGLVIANGENKMIRQLEKMTAKNFIFYGFKPNNDVVISNLRQKSGCQQFDLFFKASQKKLSLAIGLPGKYNVLNATAAAVFAFKNKIEDKKIIQALSLFKGTKRRFEMIFTANSITLYDDYAHHPDQIKALLGLLKENFPQQKTIVIFQPHTYSRTKKFLSDFAKNLTACDHCLIMDIFASAREPNDPAVSGKILTEKINQAGGRAFYCRGPKAMTLWLKQNLSAQSIVVTVGAGNIFHWHDKIIEVIKTVGKNENQPK